MVTYIEDDVTWARRVFFSECLFSGGKHQNQSVLELLKFNLQNRNTIPVFNMQSEFNKKNAGAQMRSFIDFKRVKMVGSYTIF